MTENAETTADLPQRTFDFYALPRNDSQESYTSDIDKQDDSYVFIKFLGRGSYGTVNLYQNTIDNSLVVWKEIDLKR